MKSFSELFKKLRFQSGIGSLRELCEMLAGFGFIFEESTLSRWQSGSRTPQNRQLLITLIKIFASKQSISTFEEANIFLRAEDPKIGTSLASFSSSKTAMFLPIF